MPLAEIHALVEGPISCHAWNKDRTELAVVPNGELIIIFARVGTGWTKKHTLAAHEQLVTGLDWCPISDRLVSVSQDRNGYVWSRDNASPSWRPTLVELRLKRSPLRVRWNGTGTKFAVTSVGSMVAVAHYEAQQDWWICKHLKKPLGAATLALDWHSNGVLLALGTLNCKVHVLSAFIKTIDQKQPETSSWGEKLVFGTECATFETTGWVHDVAFSPSSESLAWLSHDSSLTIHYHKSGFQSTVVAKSLPFLRIRYVSENVIMAVGHDPVPILFSGCDGQQWKAASPLDSSMAKADSSSKVSATSSAFEKFRSLDSRAQTADTSRATEKDSNGYHINSITEINVVSQRHGDVSKVSTTALDGRLVLWDITDPVATAETALLKVC